jgi:hypothetical protein
MPDNRREYRSIKDVRSSLYPRSAALLNLERGDVIEFPSGLADVTREIADRISVGTTDTGAEEDPCEVSEE